LIGSVLGRRMLGQYVGAAMLPIGALAVLDYLHAGNIHFIQVSALAAALVIVLGRVADVSHRGSAATACWPAPGASMEHDFRTRLRPAGATKSRNWHGRSTKWPAASG